VGGDTAGRRPGDGGTFAAYPARTRLLERWAPRSLRGRAVLIVVAPAVLCQAIALWIFYDRHFDTLSRRLADGIAGDVQTIVYLFQAHPERRADTLDIASSAMRLQVRYAEGDILDEVTTFAAQPGGWLEQTLADQLLVRLEKPFRLSIGFFDKTANIDVQTPDGVLYINAPRSRLFTSTTYIFLLWMLGSALVLSAVAAVFMRNQIRPILRLAVAADRFGRGVSVGRFKPEGAREVRRAAVALSVLRDRLDRQVGQRTQMLAGVSHDLKTVVTRMKLQLAFMPEGPETAALKDDLAEMEETLGAYLAFARGEDQEEAQPVDVAALVEDAVFAARRGGAAVNLRPLRARRNAAPVELRVGAARRALTNLLSNAARYGDRVDVGLEEDDGAVSILVDDDGPGIPAERRDEAFKPFARLDSGRNLQTGGHGLGLTIARDAARSCGGDVTLEDSPLGGLRARLRLPV